MIPTDAPDRIRFRAGIPFYVTRARDFSELIAADDGPLCPIPLSQATGGDAGWLLLAAVFAVVGVHEPALPRVQALSVITGQQGTGYVGCRFTREHPISVLIQLFYCESMDVDLIKALFHRCVVDLVRGSA